MINQTTDQSGNLSWEISRQCGIHQNTKINATAEKDTETLLHGYPIAIQIRHHSDPHFNFGFTTNGAFIVDQKPASLILSGIILLIFSLAMLGLSAYKTYRFCIKYTLRDFLADRRRRKYLQETSPRADHPEGEEGEIEYAEDGGKRVRRRDLPPY